MLAVPTDKMIESFDNKYQVTIPTREKWSDTGSYPPRLDLLHGWFADGKAGIYFPAMSQHTTGLIYLFFMRKFTPSVSVLKI